MRMPGIDAKPLPDHLEALRHEINGLPESERKALMGRLWGDRLRANDARHEANYQRAERERNRLRPDPRQMRLDGAA